MSCEFNFIDDQVATLEAQRRANIIMCLEGNKATHQATIDELTASLENPAMEHPSVDGLAMLYEEQIEILRSLLLTIDARIEFVQNADFTYMTAGEATSETEGDPAP